MTEQQGSKPANSTLDLLRSRFLAGLVTIIPALVTLWVVMLVIDLIDGNLGTYFRPAIGDLLALLMLPASFAGPVSFLVSLLLACGVIVIIGSLTRFILVRRAIGIGERLVQRIPLLRFFYATPKEVIKLITTQKGSQKRVVLIEYPRPGVWVIAYATGETVCESDGITYVCVFMATTPNPTTGFLMLVPREQVRDVNLSTEGAVRMIISGGILSPAHFATTPFAGLRNDPDLPPPEPLLGDLPPESEEERESRQ